MDEKKPQNVLADTEGLLTWRRAGEVGLSRSVFRSALATRWRFVLPGVMSTTSGALTRRQELLAALLMAGRGSMLASLTAAEWQRLVTPAALRHELEAGPKAGSRVVRRAIDEVEAGSWPVAEGDLHQLVEGSRRLPPLWLNPVLTGADGARLPIPDGWFDEVALAVQVHSWRAGIPRRPTGTRRS